MVLDGAGGESAEKQPASVSKNNPLARTARAKQIEKPAAPRSGCAQCLQGSNCNVHATAPTLNEGLVGAKERTRAGLPHLSQFANSWTSAALLVAFKVTSANALLGSNGTATTLGIYLCAHHNKPEAPAPPRVS
jgi:hypothetical protein